MWLFVGNKRKQRWLWSAWEPCLKRIVAYSFGRRSKKTCRKLLKLLAGFRVVFWCTNNFSAYDSCQMKSTSLASFTHSELNAKTWVFATSWNVRRSGTLKPQRYVTSSSVRLFSVKIICYDINQHIECMTTFWRVQRWQKKHPLFPMLRSNLLAVGQCFYWVQ